MFRELIRKKMSRKTLHIPDIICEKKSIYYAKIDFSEGVLIIGPIQVVRGDNEIPYCELNVFLNSVLLIYHQLTGREVEMDELCRYHFISERTKDIDEIGIGEKVFDTQEHQVMHNPYNHEVRKLECIKNGDIDGLKKCQNEAWTGRIGTVADNPVRQEKIRQAEYLLKYQDYSVSEIANYLSYSSQSHFSYCFKKVKGMTPLQYRNEYSKN